MRDITRDSITEAVVRSFAGAADPRTKQVIERLVHHLHAFAREVNLTHAEWRAGIEFLYRAGKISDEARNEFILCSDVLGLSSLVDLLGNASGATEGSVLGPFHAPGSRELAVGGDLAGGNEGEAVLVQGRVLDAAGRPIAGAVLEFWQTAANGLYWQQDPAQDPQNLRFRMTTGADGRYAFTTVRPAPYAVPSDGPVGDLLRALGRHAWRPAHFHFIVSAEGCRTLVTELFPADDRYVDEDAVFGVRRSLAVEFRRVESAEAAARLGLEPPFSQVDFDFRLARA